MTTTTAHVFWTGTGPVPDLKDPASWAEVFRFEAKRSEYMDGTWTYLGEAQITWPDIETKGREIQLGAIARIDERIKFVQAQAETALADLRAQRANLLALEGPSNA